MGWRSVCAIMIKETVITRHVVLPMILEHQALDLDFHITMEALQQFHLVSVLHHS